MLIDQVGHNSKGKSMDDNYSERAVCFVDILGFTSLIRRLDEFPDSHHHLLRALRRLKELDGSHFGLDPERVEISVFSDSIVLTALPQDVGLLVWLGGHLQADFLKLGFATRGGIAVGRTYHKSGVLFGEGLLEAYKIEQSASVYPRIVLHPKVVKDVAKRRISSFVDRDTDGLYFIDPFQFASMPGNAADLASEGYDPIESRFTSVRDLIVNEIALAREVNHRAKWTWLANRWNVSIERHNKSVGGCIKPLEVNS